MPPNTSIAPTGYIHVNGLGKSMNDSAIVSIFRTLVVVTAAKAPKILIMATVLTARDESQHSTPREVVSRLGGIKHQNNGLAHK